MKEDNKDKTWKDKTGRKYQSYGVEQRLEQKRLGEQEEGDQESTALTGETGLPASTEDAKERETVNLQEPPLETEVDPYAEEEEEGEFDLEAQVEEFRLQIEEEPENCLHHYNLGEALAELEQNGRSQGRVYKST